ncbi:MAG: restriction endonuclease subunit S, partial [Dolichospermum sp.]
GRDFPDWEEKTLLKANIRVIDGDRGENYPKGDDFSADGYCLFLNAKNVTKQGFIFDDVSFITKQKDETLRKGKLIRNDLIITTRGTVGNIAYFDKSIKYENIRINSGMVIIRNDNSNISNNYLYKYFYSEKFRKVLEQIAFGSAQPQLTVAEINKFKIDIPDFKEQTKIANFLTTIDEKIAQLTQKCELSMEARKVETAEYDEV